MAKKRVVIGQGLRAALALAVGLTVAIMVVVTTANYRARSADGALLLPTTTVLEIAQPEEQLLPLESVEDDPKPTHFVVELIDEPAIDLADRPDPSDEQAARPLDQQDEALLAARQEERQARSEEMMRLREEARRAQEAYQRDMLAQNEAGIEEDEDFDDEEFDDEDELDDEEEDDEEESSPSPLEEKEARLEYAEELNDELTDEFEEFEDFDEFTDFDESLEFADEADLAEMEEVIFNELAEEFAAADAARASAIDAFIAYQDSLNELASQDMQQMAAYSGAAMDQAYQVLQWLMAELATAAPSSVNQPPPSAPAVPRSDRTPDESPQTEDDEHADEEDDPMEKLSPWIVAARDIREIQESYFPELATLADQVDEAASILDPRLSEEEQHQELMDFYEALEELMDAMLGAGAPISDARI